MSEQFRELLFGKTSADENEVFEIIQDLSTQSLKDAVSEALIHRDDEEPAEIHADLNYGRPLKFNATGDSLLALETLVEKARQASLSEAQFQYLVDRMDLSWKVSVMGDGAWVPQISVVGNFIVRNHHRVLGLTDVKTIFDKKTTSAILKKLPGLFAKSSGTSQAFVVNNANGSITFNRNQFPESLNDFGQGVICLSGEMVEELSSTYPELEGISGRSSCVYLRHFQGQFVAYADGRLDDDLDGQFFNTSLGFNESSEEGESIAIPAESTWADWVYERLCEAELFNLTAIDVENDTDFYNVTMRSAFKDLAESLVTEMRYSMEPTFSPRYAELARSEWLRNAAIELDPKQSSKNILISTSGGFMASEVLDGTGAQALKSRLDLVLDALLESDYVGYIKDIQVFLPSKRGSRVKAGSYPEVEKVQKKLANFVKSLELDECLDEEEALETIKDILDIGLVLKCSRNLPIGVCVEIAKYLSEGGRASIISNRFPFYQSFYDFEEDSGSPVSYSTGVEMAFLDSLEMPDAFDSEDDDWDCDDE